MNHSYKLQYFLLCHWNEISIVRGTYYTSIMRREIKGFAGRNLGYGQGFAMFQQFLRICQNPHLMSLYRLKPFLNCGEIVNNLDSGLSEQVMMAMKMKIFIQNSCTFNVTFNTIHVDLFTFASWGIYLMKLACYSVIFMGKLGLLLWGVP